MYRLYYSPGACSMSVHIVLEEIGEPYEIELVSSKPGGRAQTAEWRAINPKGRVPALSGVPGRIGGAANLLTEAHAILFYLGRSHPEAKLWPRRLADEARCIEWMNWLASNVHAMSYGQIWRPQRFVVDEKDFAAVQAGAMRRCASSTSISNRCWRTDANGRSRAAIPWSIPICSSSSSGGCASASTCRRSVPPGRR